MRKLLYSAIGCVLTGIMSASLNIGYNFPCILFFGEYKYPDKNDYQV